MEIVVTVVLGAAVGWLAVLLNEGSPLVPSVLLGIVGAVVGDWAAGLLGLAVEGTPARWLVCGLAAAGLIGLVRVLGGLRPPLRSA